MTRKAQGPEPAVLDPGWTKLAFLRPQSTSAGEGFSNSLEFSGDRVWQCPVFVGGENEMREYECYSSPTRMILIDLSVTSRHICRSGALRLQLLKKINSFHLPTGGFEGGCQSLSGNNKNGAVSCFFFLSEEERKGKR